MGDATTTSFFPAKPLGCYGDGGAVFTQDDAIADSINSIRLHGKGTEKYDNVRIGVKFVLILFRLPSCLRSSKFSR